MSRRGLGDERFLSAALLAWWCIGLTWLLCRGRFTTFLRPEFGILLAFALCLCCLLSLALVLPYRFRPRRAPSDETWLRTFILVVPLVYMGTYEGSQLGSYAFERRMTSLANAEVEMGTEASMTKDGRLRQTMGGSPDEVVPLGQLRRLVPYFLGRRLITRGQVYKGAKAPPGHFVLYRFQVVCCVADARPMALLVRPSSDVELEEDRWVEVAGTLTKDVVRGLSVPVLIASSVTSISTPEDRYDYEPFMEGIVDR